MSTWQTIDILIVTWTFVQNWFKKGKTGNFPGDIDEEILVEMDWNPELLSCYLLSDLIALSPPTSHLGNCDDKFLEIYEHLLPWRDETSKMEQLVCPTGNQKFFTGSDVSTIQISMSSTFLQIPPKFQHTKPTPIA